MAKKDLIADIKIFSDSTFDASVKRNKDDLAIFIAGIYQVISGICDNDESLRYAIISTFVEISGFDINDIKKGIDEYEKQQ